jgi:hypothetical protein
MDAQQIEIKWLAAPGSEADVEQLTRVFHGWIQESRVTEDILVDVTDYSHVHDGPGVMLIAHGAHYGMDTGRGRLGLLYSRKRALADVDFPERVRRCFHASLHAATMLEQDPALHGKLTFRTDEVIFRIQNRLHAPPTLETFDSVEPALQSLLDHLWGPGIAVPEWTKDDPREAFTITIKATSAPGVSALFAKLT